MKFKTAIAALVCFAAVVFSACAGGFSEEIHTSFKAGPGYEKGGRVFFLLNYHLYKTPEGILRFPDGGLANTVHEGVYLIGSGSGDGAESFSMQKLVKKYRNSDVYLTAFSEEFFSGMESMFILSDSYGMNETNGLLREAGPAATGLPSPLDYCKKSKKEYINDVIRLRGDRFYRQEIIRTLVTEPSEAREILSRMEKYKQSLRPFEQSEYRLYSERVRLQLRKKGNLE